MPHGAFTAGFPELGRTYCSIDLAGILVQRISQLFEWYKRFLFGPRRYSFYGVEGQPWVPDGSTVGPRFLGGNRGFPHKNRQPWVPATSFLFCVRWATRPNCQPLTLSHLESDGGPTASMPSAARPHCILPARNLETLTIF